MAQQTQETVIEVQNFEMLCVKGLLGCDLISLLLDNDIKAFDAINSPVARSKIISGNLEHF